MFTKYPEVFIAVKNNMKNNMAVGNLLRFSISKKEKLEDIDMLIDQVVFQTLSVLEYKKVI